MRRDRPAIDRLRSATANVHRQLEADFDAVAQLGRADSRAGVIARYRALYGGAETALAPWLRDASLPPRRRPLPPGSGNGADALYPPGVEITCEAEALGFLYVIEGSTLGGRMILRQLAERGADTAGLDEILNPHGTKAGASWRTVLDVLERALADDENRIAAAVAGALKGFAFARACLCDPVPPASPDLSSPDLPSPDLPSPGPARTEGLAHA